MGKATNELLSVPNMANGIVCHDIQVDGKSLAHHFRGRTGSSPDLVSPLKSGRVPVLVCSECGDIGCGSYAVKIDQINGQFCWSDWAYEDGRDEPSAIEYPEMPRGFTFDAGQYVAEICKAAD